MYRTAQAAAAATSWKSVPGLGAALLARACALSSTRPSPGVFWLVLGAALLACALREVSSQKKNIHTYMYNIYIYNLSR